MCEYDLKGKTTEEERKANEAVEGKKRKNGFCLTLFSAPAAQHSH